MVYFQKISGAPSNCYYKRPRTNHFCVSICCMVQPYDAYQCTLQISILHWACQVFPVILPISLISDPHTDIKLENRVLCWQKKIGKNNCICPFDWQSFVQRPFCTKETISHKNTGVTSYKDHFIKRPFRTKTQEFCVQVFRFCVQIS